jgi:1-acyl-sn-glycerol-3-phosphate acyltransferase
MYRTPTPVCRPVMRWGRLQVEGLEALPESGPVLVVGNHDSHWDPIAVGVSAIRRRQIRALAKSDLWKVRGLAPILNGMGQIPIERGSGDAAALAKAIEALRRGACIMAFPEGNRLARQAPAARSGVGRLAPRGSRGEAGLRRDEGTSDLTGFPPSGCASAFERPGGQAQPGEEAVELRPGRWPRSASLVPPSISFRKRPRAG